MFRSFLLIAACAALLVLPGQAQEAGEFHEFTAKTGKTVLAKLLAISDDMRTMKIQREDGLEFESEIVTLSLDDQQYVKDWIQNRPDDVVPPIVPASDYHLELSLSKKSLDSDRHRISSSYTLEQKNYLYEISVRNISREPLVGAKLEYAIFWKDALNLVKDVNGEWDVDYNSRLEPEAPSRLLGEVEIETLAFNREAELETGTFDLDRMMYSSEVYREDEFKGIIVRVIAPSGAVIEEQRTGASWIDDLSWEKITAPRDD